MIRIFNTRNEPATIEGKEGDILYRILEIFASLPDKPLSISEIAALTKERDEANYERDAARGELSLKIKGWRDLPLGDYRRVHSHFYSIAEECGWSMNMSRPASLYVRDELARRKIARDAALSDAAEMAQVCGCLDPNENGEPSCDPPCIACRCLSRAKWAAQ